MKLSDLNALNKEFKFNVNIEFDTHIDLTPRILEVSEAFGLGINETKKFTIYKNFVIGFNSGDVIFITGDSGGGKSLLLKYIWNKIDSEKQSLDSIIPSPEETIIESIGKTTDEAVRYLSLVGLNDAFIFLRKYKELSDGQKYRYRLAKMLATSPKFIFIDEMCANLDRTTAKVIAYNLQRICRAQKITLICATTHRDLTDDLNPSLVIDKRFMDEVLISYKIPAKKQISFYSNILISIGDIGDYKVLSKYHYKNSSLDFPYTKVITAKYENDIVGVAVFSPPFLMTKGRTIKFKNKYSMMKEEVVKEINRLFIRGSRYVISPKYRGCGLGQLLAKESMKYVSDKKYVEVVTAMGNYNPVFEKIGMERVEITEEADPPTIRLDTWLKEKKIEVEEINNPVYFKAFINNLSNEDKLTLVRLTGKVLHHPKIGLSGKDGKRAEVVAQEKRYESAEFDEVYNELVSYIPKLYSGNTIYYVIQNPFWKERGELNV